MREEKNLERMWIRRGKGSRMSDWQLKAKTPEKYKSTGTKLLEEKPIVANTQSWLTRLHVYAFIGDG